MKDKINETSEYLYKRQQILNEINSNKVNIDRECFKHSTADRIALKKAKQEYILLSNTDKHNDERNKIINYILSHPISCGNLILTLNK